MSYGIKDFPKPSEINWLRRWAEDWISDWLGIFDIAVGIITLTKYYPRTQEWWFKKVKRY